ncbi:EAL domain-containing protein [Photobacterium sagamiensis]|uniref:bifunctional diguanylate cyclase/phosphodiesterase n=1 Tax=Photobacterium sagamiensis TaxID=2910241 RepID=UPI003D122492
MRITRIKPVKLSTRTALLFGAGLTAIAAFCLFFTRYFFLYNINEIENTQIRHDNEQARAIIELLVDEQENRSYDWAYWDETYELVTKGDQGYRQRNLYYDGLKALDIDLIVYLNREGQVVETALAENSMNTDRVSNQLPAELKKALLSDSGLKPYLDQAATLHDSLQSSQSGLVSVGDTIWVISITPVLTSEAEGPTGGWMVWGRHLSTIFPSRYETILSAQNSIQVNHFVDTKVGAGESLFVASVTVEKSGKNLSASTVLADINGNPLGVLTTTEPRRIYQEGNRLISWLAVILFAAAVVVGGATFYLFRHKVGRRFTALEAGLKNLAQGEYSSKMSMGGNDEFSMVGEVINQILSASSHTRNTLNNVAQKFDALYQSSNLGLLMVLDGKIVDANKTMAHILAYESEQHLVGKTLQSLCPSHDSDICDVEHMYQAIRYGERHFDIEMSAADGRRIACELEVTLIQQQGEDALMLSVKDISKQKLQEGIIRQLERRDSVTGLLNRQSVFTALRPALSAQVADDNNSKLTVLYVKLERFNVVSGIFGHQISDAVLRHLAETFIGFAPDCLVGRVAESEFVIAMEAVRDTAEPCLCAEKIVRHLHQPLTIDGVEVGLSVAVGVLFVSADINSIDELMSSAEFAAYRAMTNQSRVQVFDKIMVQQAKNHLIAQRDIANVIRLGEISPYFQPIVKADTGEVLGFEALARWSHPELGAVSPLTFIPIAEERNLIIALGEHVLNEACAFISDLNQYRAQSGLNPLSVHVNFSSTHFSHESLIPFLKMILAKYAIPPQCLVIEITESMLIGSMSEVINRMKLVKKLGVKLALDDFGTGYSALNTLCEFPLDVVKLDQSFVRRLGSDHRGEILVRNIARMSRELGLTLVAEGVETREQKDTVVSLRVDEIQGYYFYKPMPANDALARFSYRDRMLCH